AGGRQEGGSVHHSLIGRLNLREILQQFIRQVSHGPRQVIVVVGVHHQPRLVLPVALERNGVTSVVRQNNNPFSHVSFRTPGRCALQRHPSPSNIHEPHTRYTNH